MEVVFRRDDIARVRIRRSLGPLSESLQAMGALRRGSPGPWAATTRGAQTVEEAAVVRYLRPLAGVGVDLFTLGGTADTVADERGAWLDAPADWVARELDAFSSRPDSGPGWLDRARHGDVDSQRRLVDRVAAWHDRHLSAHWARIRDHLDVHHHRLGRLLTDHGVERLLGSLGNGISWDGVTLRIPAAAAWMSTPATAPLGGRGLVVVPSYFAAVPEPYFPIDQAQPALLVLPVRPPEAAPVDARSGRALQPVLGRTRARALATVCRRPCSTTELARALGVSISGASQHATALRGAGLLTTVRDGSRVLHTATALGRALAGRIDG